MFSVPNQCVGAGKCVLCSLAVLYVKCTYMYMAVYYSILHPSVPSEGFIALSVCLWLIEKSEDFSIRYSSASAYILQASY